MRAAAYLALLFLFVLFVLFVAGCSNKPGEAGSCRNEGANSCTEYTAALAVAGKRMCGESGWTNGAESCPVAGRLGTCVSKDGTKLVYGGPPNNFNASSARSACEFGGGSFTPTP